ncbi:MAG: hypothetical protein HPY66_2372 [Firmicutes bacterium]|nr:hypothetical protein [Bacillota bacterium]
MYLGISCALLVANGYLSARLAGLHSLWEKYIGTFILALAQMIVITLTLGMIPGWYRALPLTAATAIIFVLLLVICFRKGCLAKESYDSNDKSYIKSFVLVLAVTLPVWLWEFFNGVLLPPIYWDELYYHLFYPAVWARDGYIHFFDMSNTFVAGYPANLDLISGWTMVMTGTDVWAELTGLPFVFLGIAVLFAFCKRLDICPRNSFWAGLLFATTPLVIFHSKAAYIDLPVSVLFGSAIYFLFLYFREGRLNYLIIGAVTMGIIVGAKYSGPYMAIAGLIPIIYRGCITRKRLFRPSWIKIIAYYCIPVILLGSFFYIRNLILFGNPFYPMTLRIWGVTIFEGLYFTDAFNFTAPESSWVTLAKALIETEPLPLIDSFYAGFGPQLIVMAIPAFFLFLINDKQWRTPVIIIFIIPLFISIASLPAKYPRYLIHINLFLLPFIAWMFGKLPSWPGRILKALAVCCALYSVLIATPMYHVGVQDYEIAANSIWSVNQVSEGHFYKYITDFNEIKGGPLRMATGTTIQSYSLLGENWQNQIFYIQPTTEEEWIKEMLDKNIDLFICDFIGYDNPELKWIADNPEYFKLIYSSHPYYVYLVIPGDSEHQNFVDKLGAYQMEEHI